MSSKNQKQIEQICQQVWQKQPLKVRPLSSLSNYVYLLDFGDKKFVLKIWNTDQDNLLFVNKDQIDQIVKKTDLYQNLIFKEEENYCIENFVENKKMNVDHIRKLENRIRIQKYLIKYHQGFQINKNQDIQLVQLYKNQWKKIFDTISDSFKNHKDQSQIKQALNHIESYIKNNLVNKKFEKVVMCHNDLLLGNILYQEQNNAYFFIDFEYSFYNPPKADLYNFLIESIYDYETDKIEGYDKNMDTFPKDIEILKLIKFYKYYEQNPNCEKDHNQIQQNEKKELLEFYECGPLQNILWCLFGWLIVEKEGTQFDYVKFGFERYEQFKNDLENIKRVRQQFDEKK